MFGITLIEAIGFGVCALIVAAIIQGGWGHESQGGQITGSRRCKACGLSFDVIWDNDGVGLPTNKCPRCGAANIVYESHN